MRVTIALLALLLTISATSRAAEISNYQSIFRPCYDKSGKLQIAIRQFSRAGRPSFLLVNPQTLATKIVTADQLQAGKTANTDELRDTPYLKALEQTTAPPYRLQNHGARRSDLKLSGLFMTIDMCPSQRPFEQEFFQRIMQLPQGKTEGVPVAIAMTGAWLNSHPKELNWLKEQESSGRLAITWVNHSLTHPYNPRERLERTFLLTPGIDFDQEVLATEQLLLANGLLPAPFFRFPGLVADGRLLQRLKEFGLIPLGSDAWLAKGESPQNGSFILVHGNGNEPQGIRKFPSLLEKLSNFHLLPLANAFTLAAK